MFCDLTLTLPNIKTIIFESFRGRGRRRVARISPQWSDVHVYCFINFKQKSLNLEWSMSLEMNLNNFFTIGILRKVRDVKRVFFFKVVFLLSLKMNTLGPTTQGRTCLYWGWSFSPGGGRWKHFHSRVPVAKESIAQIKWQNNNCLLRNRWMLEYAWKLSSKFEKLTDS